MCQRERCCKYGPGACSRNQQADINTSLQQCEILSETHGLKACSEGGGAMWGDCGNWRWEEIAGGSVSKSHKAGWWAILSLAPSFLTLWYDLAVKWPAVLCHTFLLWRCLYNHEETNKHELHPPSEIMNQRNQLFCFFQVSGRSHKCLAHVIQHPTRSTQLASVPSSGIPTLSIPGYRIQHLQSYLAMHSCLPEHSSDSCVLTICLTPWLHVPWDSALPFTDLQL